jgi:hypothetical protein
MTKKTRSSESKESPFSNPTVVAALVTGILSLIAALVAVSPQLIPLIGDPTETPIPTFTATLAPTTRPTSTPAEPLATGTVTPVPPTPTETITPSPTPVDPGIACLDRWQVVSSNPELISTSGAGSCAVSNVPGLGISASRNGLVFGINSFREQGTFGITTSLPADATVSMTVDLITLTQGEFWIALSNTPDPKDKMMILALEPNSGEVRFYNNQTSSFSNRYEYRGLLTNTSLSPSRPYNYRITFSISGNSVNPRIHFTNLPPQIVNLPKYLFIGYNKKSTLGSMSVQVEISDLVVEIE